MELRKALFAGSWYPSGSAECEEEIRRFLNEPGDPAPEGVAWQAGVVPHAGWYYSGRIACLVIDSLKTERPIDLVVVFGMHLHRGSASYMMAEGAWETPFGPLPVAQELAAALAQQFDFQIETPKRFKQDNTIELQLPFIKRLLAPRLFLGIGVPPTPTALAIGRAVADWARTRNNSLRIIGSTDLTHYGPNYNFTLHGSGRQAVKWVREQNDRRVIEAMRDMDPDRVLEEAGRHQNACCAGAAAAALAAALQSGATRSHTLAYSTSFDKTPDESFVGYAGIVLGA